MGTGKALLGVNVWKGIVVKTSDGRLGGSGVLVISVVGGSWVRTILVGTLGGSVVESGTETVRDVGGSVCVGSSGLAPPSPSTSFALSLSTHPTLTPAVFLIGIAKHSVPAPQGVMVNFPSALQFPIFPLIQAIVPASHSVDGSMPPKNLLNSFAWSRLALAWAGDTEIV